MVFWLVASLMILVAFAFILPPVWRARALANTGDLDQRNIKIARERLAELKANRDNGGLSQSQYEEQETELELALSDDLAIGQQTTASPAQGRWLVYVLAVVIPCLSIALYNVLGDFGAITRSREAVTQDAEMPSPEAINGMVLKLAEKLKAEPDNLQGWQMLGRSYKVLKKYPEAVAALRHAHDLAKENPDVTLQYAEALMLANNNSWTGQPEELIKNILTQQPDNLNALWFAAMAAAQQNNKPVAVTYLRKMVALLPEGSPDRQELEKLIVNAQGDGSAASGDNAAQSPGKPAARAELEVSVQVSLADALRARVKPEDTVFIYAQAVSGPKMPIAITRKHVSDLPVKVSLSDADAMLPDMKLSNFQEVRLLARISKTASAMPMSGDLLGKIDKANIASTHDFQIEINQPYQ